MDAGSRVACRSATEWTFVIGLSSVAFKFPRCIAAVFLGTTAALATKSWWRALLVRTLQRPPAKSSCSSVAREQVCKEFSEFIEKNEGDGCGIFLVDGAGQGRFEFATGMLSSLSRTPASTGTRFEIASVTKMMVSYAILKLVSAKALSLDARAADYVEFKDLGSITVRQLLTHTSGLPDLGISGPEYTLRELASELTNIPSVLVHPLAALWCRLTLAWYGDVRMNKFKFHSQAIPMFASRGFDCIWDSYDAMELLFREYEVQPPGAYFYSDANYTIVGLILERIHKCSLHDVLKQEVFDPLQMGDTYYRFSSHTDHSVGDSQLSSRYRNSKNGKFPFGRSNWTFADRTLAACPLLTVPPCYVSAYFAADCVVSTARDLCKFMRGLHASTEIWDMMMSSIGPEDAQVEAGKVSKPYGLGIKCVSEGALGARFGHGGNGGCSLYYWPEQDVVFAGTTNNSISNYGTFIHRMIASGSALACLTST